MAFRGQAGLRLHSCGFVLRTTPLQAELCRYKTLRQVSLSPEAENE